MIDLKFMIHMKKIIILLLLMTQSVAAQNSANKVSEAERKHFDRSTNPQAILADLRADLSGLQAEFTQYELLENNQKSDINTGQVYMQSPAQFRWQYQQPVEQLIVADGENVWIYDEDLEQVTVKTQDNQLNPIYVIINDEMSQQHYELKHESHNDGTDWVSLTPKQPNDEVKTVWLAVTDNLVKQIKVENQFEQTMVFEFNDIKRNPEFADGLFEFVPPDGVDVIRAMNQNPTE
jgi:outer membrane lipoprotein carrier protein